MASEEAKELVHFVRELSICKNPFLFDTLEEQFQAFLTNVEVPCGFADNDLIYKLEPYHIVFKFRNKLAKKFIETKKSEGLILTEFSHLKQFFDELKQFVESESEEDVPNLDLDNKSRKKFDLFKENVKVEGVIVWKSSRTAKACVLVKDDDRRRNGATVGSFSLSELTVNVHEKDDPDHEGFHLNLAVGDIVKVTEYMQEDGTALEPEILKCCSLSDTEIASFLTHLSNYARNSGSSATVIEITRFSAAWEYILNLSKEKYTDEIILQILEIINRICSVVPKSLTVTSIAKGFQQSVLFRSILPDFINKLTGEMKSHVSMVQKILEHVVTAVPSSGLQMLPMATDLAHNLVRDSSEPEAKTSGHSAIDFLSKLCSIIASEVPRAKKDLDVLPWKELSLIPVTEELFRPIRLQTSDLPVIKKEGQYESEEDYLNTYYRLLREECFYKLRKGISDFVKNGQKCDSKDLTMYRVSLLGCSTLHEDSPTVMLISLEYELSDLQAGPESERADWLLYGNLLCISLDGSFEEPVWAVVERHLAEQRIVGIALCEKGNEMSEPMFIAKMQESKNKGNRAFMAESQTFYVSHAPALEILQHRDGVPFKDYLVYPGSKIVEPPDYISKIKHPPDWGIILKREGLSKISRMEESSSNYNLLEDFAELRLKISSSDAKPDETQLAAIQMALKNRVMLIQGPPGTGKSFVGVTLVQLLLSMKVPQEHGPILVVTFKNHALDNFLKECLGKVSSPDVKIVRVGRLHDDAGEDLKKCLLREWGRRVVNRKPGLYNQRRKLLAQIWALQPKVRDAFEKLTASSRFSAEMFLKEASKDQLMSLVIDSKEGTLSKEEVEKLFSKHPKDQAKLRELVENALKDWLPSQESFDRFSGEKTKLAPGKLPAKSDQHKSKDDQQDQENPIDARDPSVEQRERLLALDEEIADEEDKKIAAQEEEISRKSQHCPIVQCLRNLVCLDEAELNSYKDILKESKVWDLGENRRVQFVYALQSKYFDQASSEFMNVSGAYVLLHQQLKKVRNQQDIEVMKRCHVIGMTVTGATMRANLLADIKPSVMIVEEAAEILEGQLVAVIPPSVQHLIMIGDHKQLKPMVHYHRLKKSHHLDLSMFERLWNCGLPCKQLGFQCRMREEFVDLLRELKIYDNLQTHRQLVKDNVPPACVKSSMYFWTHTSWEEGDSPSKRNRHEAREITRVAKHLCQEGGIPASKITVLCSYRGQVKEIESQFHTTKSPALEKIKVTTIDSFQGQENDIILVSLVRSNKEGTIGYLAAMDRLCVAISRARCGLYLFGNHAHLSLKSRKGWKVVSDFMRDKRQLGSRFPLCSSEDSKSAKDVESSSVGRSSEDSKSAKDVESSSVGESSVHVVVNAQNAYINVGGTNSRNTINATSPGDSPLLTSSPRHSGIGTPPSGKTPVQDPKSPVTVVTSLFDTPTPLPTGTTQDARPPTQATSGGRKSLDFCEDKKLNDRPVQESANPKVSTDKTSANEDPGVTHLTGEHVSQEKPKQMEIREDETEVQPVVNTGDLLPGVEDRPLQETKHPDERDVSGEQSLRQFEELDKAKPMQETKGPGKDDKSVDQSLKSFEEPEKQKPLQETKGPGKEGEGLSEGKPLQETASSAVKTKNTEDEEVLSTQETMGPSKGHSEESVLDKGSASQETGRPGEEETAEKEKAGEIQKGNDILPAEQQPEQETASPKVESDGFEEDAAPTQETMAAGKGPFEEFGLEVGLKAHPTDEGDDVSPAESPESIQPKQETASTEVESEGFEEGAAPTQEAMAAGKVPFEESGLEVGVKAHPTDEGDDVSPAQSPGVSIQPKQETASTEVESDGFEEDAAPTQETMAAGKVPFEESCLGVGVKVHPTEEVDDVSPKESPESIQPKQESANTEIESDGFEDDAAPTQETMAAGKGPFEESGLEVGVKARPTDEGDDVSPEKSPESIQPKQETASTEVESDSVKEEAVPTQETMAAGKGPFEESGLEVGLKAHPTDDRE